MILAISYYNQYRIENEPLKYAIGEIKDYKVVGSVSPSFKYDFFLNGKKFEGDFWIVDKLGRESHDSLRKYIGKKYFVKYIIDDPQINKLMLDHPIWDGLEQPPNGWYDIPYSLRFKKDKEE